MFSSPSRLPPTTTRPSSSLRHSFLPFLRLYPRPPNRRRLSACCVPMASSSCTSPWRAARSRPRSSSRATSPSPASSTPRSTPRLPTSRSAAASRTGRWAPRRRSPSRRSSAPRLLLPPPSRPGAPARPLTSWCSPQSTHRLPCSSHFPQDESDLLNEVDLVRPTDKMDVEADSLSCGPGSKRACANCVCGRCASPIPSPLLLFFSRHLPVPSPRPTARSAPLRSRCSRSPALTPPAAAYALPSLPTLPQIPSVRPRRCLPLRRLPLPRPPCLQARREDRPSRRFLPGRRLNPGTRLY